MSKKRKEINNSVEILFCMASSIDDKGKRVLVREGIAENVFYAAEDIQDVDVKLLGIGSHIKQITEFLARDNR